MALELAGTEPPGGPGPAGRPDRGAVELVPADPVPAAARTESCAAVAWR